jgi:predicted nucleic acid-binding protein
LILDAGFLVSVDRDERSAKSFLNASIAREWRLVTTEPVIAQVWRQGRRQARLAAFLKSIESIAFDDGREVGALLAAASASDPIDAHIVIVAARLREPILTGDPDDISQLCDALGDDKPKIMEWPNRVL